MKISILTTIGGENLSPDERQDKWIEALTCYLDFADEVVVVNGGIPFVLKDFKRLESLSEKDCWLKFVDLKWPYEWNWVQLPKSLNAGREQCTGEWIIRMDIDQFFHEKDFDQIRKKLAECPKECQVATFQKMSMTYGGRYYQKGGQPIAFRNNPGIVIGKNLDRDTDLCFAVKQTGTVKIGDYDLPVGKDLLMESALINEENKDSKTLEINHYEVGMFKTGISYWNYDYFFKTKEFTRKEFWRFSRAHHRYFGDWIFGDSEEESFKHFLDMQKGRYDRSPYTYKLEDHPKYIREAVKSLVPESFGFNGWNLI